MKLKFDIGLKDPGTGKCFIVNIKKCEKFPSENPLGVYTIYIIYKPTGNCQSFSIMEMGTVLNLLNQEEFKTIILAIRAKIGLRLMLTDFRENWLNTIEGYFEPRAFLVKSKFTNTYSEGREMYLCMIDTDYFM